jgi:hypothetical protein
MSAIHSRGAARFGAIGLLLLSLSGCAGGGGTGSGTGADDAVSVVVGGAERTLGARTFRYEMRGSGGESGRLFVHSGVVDFDRKLFGMVQAPGGRLPVDDIFTADGKTYRRAELFPRSLEIKTPWATLDHKVMADALGIEGPVAEPGDKEAEFDPATMLEELRKDAERVDRDGTEVVRGVATTRYAVTLKPKPEAKTPADPDEPPQPEQGPMTIWVGEDGLVRRLETRVVIPAFGGSPAQEMQSTVEFFDFGVPVDLKVPAPSETTDVTTRWVELMKTHVSSDATAPSSVRSWSTVTTGKVGSTRWTFQQGKAANGSVCTRLRLDPPVQIPSSSGIPPVPSMPPGFAGSAPPSSQAPPPPLPPEVLATLASGGSGSAPPFSQVPPPPPLVAPDGSIVPFPPVRPPTSGPEDVDSSTVPGTGVGCSDFLTSAHGFIADAGGFGWLFGVVPPGAQEAKARFAGGAEAPVTFHDGLFVIVHSASQRLEQLVFTRHGQDLQVCKPPSDETGIAPLLC